jgi:hypothetical protein
VYSGNWPRFCVELGSPACLEWLVEATRLMLFIKLANQSSGCTFRGLSISTSSDISHQTITRSRPVRCLSAKLLDWIADSAWLRGPEWVATPFLPLSLPRGLFP